MTKGIFSGARALLSTIALLGLGSAHAADILATPNSLANHVWATHSPTGALPLSNGVLTSGQFNYAAFGLPLPVAVGPSFTVSRLAGAGLISVRSRGQSGYQPGHQPIQDTGYPGLPSPASGWPQQIELSATGALTTIRYDFSEALPPGTIVWAQDVDTSESVVMRFYSCSNTVVNPSAFDSYILSQQAGVIPPRTFNSTNITINATSATFTEPTFGIVVRSNQVCHIEIDNAPAAGSNQFYLSIPRPRILLQKALGSNGRRLATDQFTMEVRKASNNALVNTGSNATSTGSGTVITAGTGVTGTTFDDILVPYTLGEVASGGTDLNSYTSTINCTNADTTSTTVLPSGQGRSFSITFNSLADDIICTLTNSYLVSNLSLTKTNTPASGPTDLTGDSVVNGSTSTYSLVVRNGGPDAISNALLKDTPSATLQNCALGTPACTVSAGTGTCPAVGTAAGQLSIGNLLGAGVTIPQIGNGGALTFLISCTVNASP